MKKILKEEDYSTIIKLYIELKSATKVAKIFNCETSTILRFLKKNNIKIDMRVSKSKFSCEETKFDIINEETAYWLGFLMADGSNNEKLNYINFVQRTSEKDNLTQLKEFLKYTGEIKDYINQSGCHYSRLYITNLYLSKRLSELGIKQNKTHILEFPNYINSDILFKNFLRGYFDGDGSISYGIFKIVGNLKFLEVLQNEMIKYLDLNKTKLSKSHPDRNNDIYTMSYGGKRNINKIYNFIYIESTTFYSKYKKTKFEMDKIKMKF